MPVSFNDDILIIKLPDMRPFNQTALLTTQAHGPTQIRIFISLFETTIHRLPFSNQGDHRILGLLVKFSTVRSLETKFVPRKFYDRYLHAETDTKIRHTFFTGILDCHNLAFNTPVTKTAWYQNGISVFEASGAGLFDIF